jgi:hypothetical protein
MAAVGSQKDSSAAVFGHRATIGHAHSFSIQKRLPGVGDRAHYQSVHVPYLEARHHIDYRDMAEVGIAQLLHLFQCLIDCEAFLKLYQS